MKRPSCQVLPVLTMFVPYVCPDDWQSRANRGHSSSPSVSATRSVPPFMAGQAGSIFRSEHWPPPDWRDAACLSQRRDAILTKKPIAAPVADAEEI